MVRLVKVVPAMRQMRAGLHLDFVAGGRGVPPTPSSMDALWTGLQAIGIGFLLFVAFCIPTKTVTKKWKHK